MNVQTNEHRSVSNRIRGTLIQGQGRNQVPLCWLMRQAPIHVKPKAS